MRRKFLILLILSLLVGWMKPDWVNNSIIPFGKQVVQTLSTKSASISLDPYAKTVGATLVSPSADGEQVNGTVTISGFIRQASTLSSPYVWIEVTYLGKKIIDLPLTMQYYTPLLKGSFKQSVQLFHGRGDYSVTLRVAGEQQDVFFPLASFRVGNINSQITRDISYSTVANQLGLHINQPAAGYQIKTNTIRIEGRLTKPNSVKTLLFQVRKGKRIWRKIVSSTKSTFHETIPLLFGKGIHEIHVMVPDGKRKEYYLEGAAFFVENESDTLWNPIQYSEEYEERGIELTTPIAGGAHQGLTYRVAGRINPNGKNARETDHLVVRTVNGKAEATYFIPVKNYRFDSDVYFRFGNGTYTVSLLAPENTKKHRDYFRFFLAAQCTVSVNGIQDVRDLVPSRGVDCNNHRIINLANQLTQAKISDMDKAKAIYTYVAKSMVYDVQKLQQNAFSWNDSSLKALDTKKGVCQDYVYLTLALLRASGIPSRFVEGMTQGQAHAWVESRIGNRWITMDPTWGSGYLQNGRFIRKVDLTYFNPPITKIAKTHRRTGLVY